MAILGYIKKKRIYEFLNSFKKQRDLKISDYLDMKNILFLKSKNRKDSIKELVDHLSDTKQISDKDLFYKKIIQREKMVSTAIGMGVAAPNALVETFDDFFITVGIIQDNIIQWSIKEKKYIKVIFLIGGPKNKHSEYLHILAKIANFIKDPNLRENLTHAKSKEIIYDFFAQY